jgi:hypothetical protein
LKGFVCHATEEGSKRNFSDFRIFYLDK